MIINNNNYIKNGKIFVEKSLYNFVNKEILKNTKITPKRFWNGLDKAMNILKPKNEELLQKREEIQSLINNWHIKNREKEFNILDYKKFLIKIGYLKNHQTL